MPSTSEGKALQGSRVLVLGVAYKKDADDARESPALEIIEVLLAKGALTDYSDPYFPQLPIGRRHALHMESMPLTAETLAGYDAWSSSPITRAFPYDLIHGAARAHRRYPQRVPAARPGRGPRPSGLASDARTRS